MKQTLRPIVLLFMIFSYGNVFSFESGEARATSDASPPVPVNQVFSLRVPLFSALFKETPIAVIDGQPLLINEVTPRMSEFRHLKETDGKKLLKKFNQVLDSLIIERLGDRDPENVLLFTDRTITKNGILTLQVPIFSPYLLFTPVATVNNESIPMGEFTRDLNSMHAEFVGAAGEEHQHDTPASLLERLVAVRLVEQEARNIGLDQTPSIQRQVERFAEKTLLYELLNLQVQELTFDTEKANTFYHDISLEAKLRSFRFQQQKDAEDIIKKLDAGEDFDLLIQQQIGEGKAVEEEYKDYVPFKELRSSVASAASKMEIGEVSQIYKIADGFVIFKLLDRRFMEDSDALELAEKITWDQQVAAKTTEYINDIVGKYAEFNEAVKEEFNFPRIKEKNPDIKLSEALMQFEKDDRILVTVNANGQKHTMTLRELASKLRGTYFHGTENLLDAVATETRSSKILEDWIFRIAGRAEAQSLGLEQSTRYLLKVEEFERRTLFDHFMQKAIVNDLRTTEKEVREYYDKHLDEFSTPTMLKMRSLAFYEKKKAEDALKKLQSGSDFKWVSANSEGLVQTEDKDLLDFNTGILSLTSLPLKFQKGAEEVRSGDSIIYSDSEKFHYLLYFEKVFSPEPKPYNQVREQIHNIVFKNNVDNELKTYVNKLKDHYPTEIYLEI